MGPNHACDLLRNCFVHIRRLLIGASLTDSKGDDAKNVQDDRDCDLYFDRYWKTVNEQANSALKGLVRDRGRRIIRDPRACEKSIAQILPEGSLECILLQRAVREQIPHELLDVRVPIQLQVLRLARRLKKVSAVRIDVARWAVEAWADALGIERPR